jgi:hypothetical protein
VDAQARTIVVALLASLGALEAFAAWRISRAADSGLRSPSELEWDPPSARAWQSVDDLPNVHNRALALLQSVSLPPGTPELWRARRDVSEDLHALVDAVAAQRAYRAALDHLEGPDGEASAALDRLDRARQLWQTSAARWGVDRAELLQC